MDRSARTAVRLLAVSLAVAATAAPGGATAAVDGAEPDQVHIYRSTGAGAYGEAASCSEPTPSGTVCETTYVGVAESASLDGGRTEPSYLYVQSFSDTYDADRTWVSTTIRSGAVSAAEVTLSVDPSLGSATATGVVETLVCSYAAGAIPDCSEGGPAAVQARWDATGEAVHTPASRVQRGEVHLAISTSPSEHRPAALTGSAFGKPLPQGAGEVHRADDVVHLVSRATSAPTTPAPEPEPELEPSSPVLR